MERVAERAHVEVQARADRGKNANRRIRAAGRIPGNVYGLNLDPYAVSVDPRSVEQVLRLSTGRNTIFRLQLAGGKESRDVMIRELQRDPVTDRLIHVDFVRVDLTKAVTVSVPVHLVGTPTGVKNEGGVLDFVQRSVEVSCLPDAIPEQLDVDVSELHVNQNVAVKDLVVGEGITVEDDPEAILAVVAAARAEIVEGVPEEEGEAAEEPEVAGEAEGEEAGKKKEEGAE
jgi:large subunit ribosomal protein L25